MFENGLWETEVLEFHDFSWARLPVEVEYAVYSSIVDLLKCYWKLKL